MEHAQSHLTVADVSSSIGRHEEEQDENFTC